MDVINSLLSFSIVHIIAVSIMVLGLVISGLLIWKHSKKYENTELLWIIWWLTIVIILGVKFL